MDKKERILKDLRDEVYNAEDRLDGEYNEDADEFNDCVDINQEYTKMLESMRRLVNLINLKYL